MQPALPVLLCARNHGRGVGRHHARELRCRPVIDVLPDLRAVRCFGMSAFEKVGIRDYANVNDLAAHFMRRIDRPAYRIKAMPECENCHLRRTWLCCQGCMGYKMVEIEKMNAERGE